MQSSSNPSCPDKEDIKDFGLTFSDTIEKVDKSLWNGMIPASNLLMQSDYLELIEATQKEKLGFRYVLVYKGDVVVGAMYFQVIHFSGHDVMNYFPEDATGIKGYFYKTLKVIARPFVSNAHLKLLVSGNIFMTGESGFYFSENIDKPTQALLLRKALNEIVASDKGIKVAVVSDLYEPRSVFDENFMLCDFNEILLEPDMSLKIREQWTSFDDYMSTLSSKYRLRAKKTFSVTKANNIVQKELSEEEIEKYSGELFTLYNKVMENARFKLGTFSKDYFSQQKQQLPDNYKLFAYFRGDELMSFISCFQSGKKMDVHYIGMDAAACKPLHLYQRMLYDMIALGIQNRSERLHFGRTAPEIKSTVGAVPSPTYGYLKHFNPIINFLIRLVGRYFKPEQYIFRNPFKD